VRFAATQLLGQDGSTRLNTISLDRLQRFTDRMFRLSEDELVHKFHLAVSDAESLAPALLTYCEIARGLGLDKVHVSEFNLRAALLTEMAVGAVWTEDFTEQIVRSALDLAHKFHVDEAHATHVAQLSRELFHQMQDLHQLEPRSALVLYLAALLHEVGMYVNDRAFHKHSLYVINNSHLFGLGSRDVLLVALVARYHRRGSPKPIHQGYSSLDRADRIAVAKMAAILRIADSLDASRSQRIKHFVCASETDRFVVNVSDVDDLSLEQLSVQQKGPLFEEVFGVPVLLRRRRVS
jgi:exopolyphosphatase/guanosine-5'-triphosphate,3'-diphosphate pyrophosphatase